MPFATVDALRESLAHPTPRTGEYAAKMLHPVPKTTVVDRVAFVLDRCRGKRVLELGASGRLHTALVDVAVALFGIDRETSEGVYGYDLDVVSRYDIPCDLDGGPEIIVCGEILEHLSNPGWLLTRLHQAFPSIPVLITVPNAFSAAGAQHMAQGIENVNRDHVAWYSYQTLKTLLARTGYAIETFHWYGGDPNDAEGLVVVAGAKE